MQGLRLFYVFNAWKVRNLFWQLVICKEKEFKRLNKFLFEKLRKRNIEQKRNAQFLAYRELCIFVNKYF